MRHREFGVLVHDRARATPGYTLFSPLNGKATYIIGLRGDVAAPMAASAGHRHLRLSPGERQPALGRAACRKGRSTWAAAAG